MIFTMWGPVSAEAAESVNINILATSDLHGFLRAYDYGVDAAATKGLTKAATIIAAERVKDPNLLLVDVGDATQGNFVSDFRNQAVHPVISAFNYLKYDAFVLGNHEFNYEFSSLQNIISDFNGTILGGNIYKADNTRFTNAYVIKEVKGVKVAIFGITAPHVSRWESDKSHYDNMTFTTPMEETGKILAELEGKADVIIGLCHYGEEGEYDTEGMYEIAAKYADQVDAFFIGHSHSLLAKYMVNGELTDTYSSDATTVIDSSKTQGEDVGKISLTLEKTATGWDVTDRVAENIVTKDAVEDTGLVDLLKDVHTESVKTANTVVGKVAANFYDDPYYLPGIPNAVITDGPLLDLINTVQMEKTGADVSLAALFDVKSNLLKGDYKKKDGVNVYKYDNTLFAVKVTGKQLKAIMEQQAGTFFNQYVDGDVTISFNENIRLYNYDVFAGVDYEIDISKPAGKRIINVMYKGKALKDDEKLVLALNNYRYGGLSASGMISADSADVVYDSAATDPVPAVRDMISEYVAASGTLTPKTVSNWKIVGYNFDYVGTEKVYDLLRSGKLLVPTSADGRTSNIKAINMKELATQGIITAAEALRPVVVEEKEDTKEETKEDVAIIETNKVKKYTVVKGDCLYRIAIKFKVTLKALVKANKEIKNIRQISIGQKIVIPE